MSRRKRGERLLGSERQDLPMTEINITPLTDVLLVLLVIFLVTANALGKHGFELPATRGVSKTVEKSTVVLRISPDGELTLAGKPLSMAEAENELLKLDSSPVLLAHPKTRYGRVIEALDLARKCGHSDIAVSQGE